MGLRMALLLICLYNYTLAGVAQVERLGRTVTNLSTKHQTPRPENLPHANLKGARSC